jgi:hypothetical protein
VSDSMREIREILAQPTLQRGRVREDFRDFEESGLRGRETRRRAVHSLQRPHPCADRSPEGKAWPGRRVLTAARAGP